MSGQQKRAHTSIPDDSGSNDGPPVKRRLVQKRTVEKWIAENDVELNTISWLKFKMADRNLVESISCAVCTQFKDKLESLRNYRPAFIDGTTNVRASSFKEHADTDMHARAMILFRKQQRCLYLFSYC